MPIRILSVDDNALLREAIAAVIENQPDMVLVAQASCSSDAIQKHRALQPDVTLMDLRLPDASGIDALIAIRAEFPDARVIVLTTFENEVESQRAMAAGARGYLLKTMPPNELMRAIRNACVQS
jgi:DNA-binding NarL/FixJ family response regulator